MKTFKIVVSSDTVVGCYLRDHFFFFFVSIMSWPSLCVDMVFMIPGI